MNNAIRDKVYATAGCAFTAQVKHTASEAGAGWLMTLRS